MINVLRNFAKETAEWKPKFLAHDVFKNGLLCVSRLAKNILKMEEWNFEHRKRAREEHGCIFQVLQSSDCFWSYLDLAWDSSVNLWPRMRENLGSSSWACATQKNKLFTLGVHLRFLSPIPALSPAYHPPTSKGSLHVCCSKRGTCLVPALVQSDPFLSIGKSMQISPCLLKTLPFVHRENAKPKIGISDTLCSTLLPSRSSPSFGALRFGVPPLISDLKLPDCIVLPVPCDASTLPGEWLLGIDLRVHSSTPPISSLIPPTSLRKGEWVHDYFCWVLTRGP